LGLKGSPGTLCIGLKGRRICAQYHRNVNRQIKSACGGHRCPTIGHSIQSHWRGIAQAGIVVAASVGSAACDVGTAGACIPANLAIGAAAGGATYSVSGGQHSPAGFARAGAEGTAVAAASIACATGLCGAATAAAAVNLVVGATQGSVDYLTGPDEFSWSGLGDAALAGGASNAPVPWHSIWKAGGGD